jgi:hypothetical protein
MFNAMDVQAIARKEVGQVLGWRVAISSQVWDRCVAVPKRVGGGCEGCRSCDLLASLEFSLSMRRPARPQILSGLNFDVNVVNDGSRLRHLLLGGNGPSEDVQLAAYATFDDDGEPLLVVLTACEAAELQIVSPEG